MSSEVLTKEQKAFLEECILEFSERFTASDVEFKKIYDSETPAPPIVTPWYGKQRFNHRDNRDRDRPSGSYSNFRNRDREDTEFSNNCRGRKYEIEDRRYRPY